MKGVKHGNNISCILREKLLYQSAKERKIRILHCVEMIDILIEDDIYLHDRRNQTWGWIRKKSD